MEALMIIFVIILGIGAIIFGLAILGVTIAYWWIVIPIIGIAVGGWIGFLFCLGLVAIIGMFVASMSK